jgi:PAS domain S-box-containing protein
MSTLRDLTSLHAPIRYALAVILPVATLAVTLTLWPIIHDSPLLLFYVAVSVTAWLGGLGPGLIAAVASVFLAEWFLFEPLYTLPSSLFDVIQILMFMFVAGLISWLEHQRKRSMETAERTRDEIHVIIESISDAITAQDIDGNVLFANDAAASLLGYSAPSRVVGLRSEQVRPRYSMLSEDGRPFSYDNLPRVEVLKTGQPAQATFLMRFNDTGEQRWIELKTAPVRDRPDAPIRMFVNIFRDVTREKEAALRLQAASQRLQNVLDHLGTFVILISPEGDVIEVNDTALGWLRTSSDLVAGKTIVDTTWWMSGPISSEEVTLSLERCRGGTPVLFDTTMRTDDETQRHVEMRMAAIRHPETGKAEMIVLAGVDITDRKRKEERLGQLTLLLDSQRQRLNRILNSVPGVIFETSGGHNAVTQKYEFVSDQVSQLLGYSPVEIVGKPNLWMGFVHPDDWERAIAEAETIYRTGEPGTFGFRGVRRNGETIHMEARMQTVFNELGEPIGTTGVLMDVTQRREAELALAEYARELRRSNSELEQFAYIASHDLQEPLRMVTSYLQLIETRYAPKLDDTAREFINFAVDGGNRMKRLIQDLLTYSRVNRERTEPKTVDMHSVMNTVLDNLKMTIAEKNAIVEVETELPMVQANEMQMVQLMQNLVGNALKFCHEDKPPHVRIGAVRSGNEMIFSVADNCIGIEAQYLERIFVIFQRLHSREQYEGTGIGLAICRKIVETYGGRIWAESTPGEGATFFFTMPVRTEKWSYDRLQIENSLKSS